LTTNELHSRADGVLPRAAVANGNAAAIGSRSSANSDIDVTGDHL
jgi:hypothetical protein